KAGSQVCLLYLAAFCLSAVNMNIYEMILVKAPLMLIFAYFTFSTVVEQCNKQNMDWVVKICLCIASFCMFCLPLCYIIYSNAHFALIMYIAIICSFLSACTPHLTIDYRLTFFVCSAMQCLSLTSYALCSEFWPMGYLSSMIAFILFSIGQIYSLKNYTNYISDRWTAVTGLLFIIGIVSLAISMEIPLSDHIQQSLFGALCITFTTFVICSSHTMKEENASSLAAIFFVSTLVFPFCVTEKTTALPIFYIFLIATGVFACVADDARGHTAGAVNAAPPQAINNAVRAG
ncbi:hypothetical protein PFISCL1PPCAC_27722, partial [Pristionchus fissidentatus]